MDQVLTPTITIVKDTAFYNPKVPVLLQIPKRIVTVLVDSSHEMNNIPVETPRGSKKLLTLRVDTNTPRPIKEALKGSIPLVDGLHLPFITEEEMGLYGKKFLSKVSAIRCMYAKKKSVNIIDEAQAATPEPKFYKHQFLVDEGEWVSLS